MGTAHSATPPDPSEGRRSCAMGQLVGLNLLGIVLVLLVERLLALRNQLKASSGVGSVDLNCIEAGPEDSDILPSVLAFFTVGLQCPGPQFCTRYAWGNTSDGSKR